MPSTARIHVGYVIGILLAIIVALTTVEWGGIRELVNYINFALTVSSLMLAVLAIIYAFVSNNSYAMNIGMLQAASREITVSSEEVKRATSALTERVAGIPVAIEAMGRKFDETQLILTSLASRTAASDSTVQSVDAEPKTLSDIPDRFLSGAPLMGLLSLYACAKSLEENKALDFTALAKYDKPLTDSYLFAFALAASYAGVVAFEDQEGGGRRVRDVAQPIRDGVRRRILEVADRMDQQPEMAGTKMLAWIQARMTAIDAYFRGDPPPQGDGIAVWEDGDK